MKKNPIIYIHYGYSKYLPYIFKCAKISNPDTDVILLGDPSNKKVAEDCGLIHFSLKDFDFGEDLKTFDRVYELIATSHFDAYKHGEDWNKFVFRKWFILYNFLTKQGIERFWHFDSDNPILSDLSKLEHKFLHLDCTVQCHGHCFKGFFTNSKIIDLYVKKINEVFLRKSYIEQFKASIANQSGPASFNEMTVYEIFAREKKFNSRRLDDIIDDSTFGDIISRSNGMKMEKLPLGEDVQITHLNFDGRFFCIEEASGKLIHMHILNLSWMPIYIYDAVFKHLKKNHKKPKQPFSARTKTLAQISVPLKQKLKFLRKRIKSVLKGKKYDLTRPVEGGVNVGFETNPELYSDYKACLEFLRNIKNSDYSYPKEKVKFHIYTEIKTAKELMAIKSYLATQNLEKTELIVWSDYDISDNILIQPYKKYITLKVYNPMHEAVGTPLEGNKKLKLKDGLYYLQSDLARILLLYKYGGVWYDMDVILLRDFKPILKQEYMYQWGGETDFEKQGACATVIAGKTKSEFMTYLMKELMRTKAKANSVCWGKKMFARIYRKYSFNILPCGFFNTEWCMGGEKNNYLGSEIESRWFFNPLNNDQHLFLEAFAWHWHNSSKKKFNVFPGSKFDLLEKFIDKKLQERGI